MKPPRKHKKTQRIMEFNPGNRSIEALNRPIGKIPNIKTSNDPRLDEGLKILKEAYDFSRIKLQEFSTIPQNKSHEQSSKIYSALSTLLYSCICISKADELEKYIRKKSTSLPTFDLKEWSRVLHVASEIRRDYSSRDKFGNSLSKSNHTRSLLMIMNKIKSTNTEIRDIKSDTLLEMRAMQESFQGFKEQVNLSVIHYQNKLQEIDKNERNQLQISFEEEFTKRTESELLAKSTLDQLHALQQFHTEEITSFHASKKKLEDSVSELKQENLKLKASVVAYEKKYNEMNESHLSVLEQLKMEQEIANQSKDNTISQLEKKIRDFSSHFLSLDAITGETKISTHISLSEHNRILQELKDEYSQSTGLVSSKDLESLQREYAEFKTRSNNALQASSFALKALQEQLDRVRQSTGETATSVGPEPESSLVTEALQKTQLFNFTLLEKLDHAFGELKSNASTLNEQEKRLQMLEYVQVENQQLLKELRDFDELRNQLELKLKETTQKIELKDMELSQASLLSLNLLEKHNETKQQLLLLTDQLKSAPSSESVLRLESELKAACSLSFDLLEKYSEASRRLQSISASRTEDANLLRDELQAACSLSRNLIERCGKTEGELKIASDLSLEMMDKYVRSEGELKVASELSREMIEKYEKSEGELRAACLLSYNLLEIYSQLTIQLTQHSISKNSLPNQLEEELKQACMISKDLITAYTEIDKKLQFACSLSREIISKFLSSEGEKIRLTRRLEELEQLSSTLRMESLELSKQFGDSQEELKVACSLTRELYDKFEKTEGELRLACEKSSMEANTQLNEQSQKIHRLEEELRSLTSRTEELSSKLSASEHQANVFFQQNTDLELKLQFHETSHQESLQKIHELENKLQSTEASNFELSAKYSATSLELESALKSNSSAELCASNLLTDSLFKQVVAESEEREMMAHFEKQLALLTSKHDKESKSLESRLTEASEQLSEALQRNSMMEAENEKILSNYREQIESLNLHITNQEKINNNSQKNYQHEIDSLKHQISSQKEDNQNITSKLKSEIDILNLKMSSQETENESIQHALRNQIGSLKVQISDKEQEFELAKSIAKEKIDSLIRQMSTQENQITQLRTAHDQAVQEMQTNFQTLLLENQKSLVQLQDSAKNMTTSQLSSNITDRFIRDAIIKSLSSQNTISSNIISSLQIELSNNQENSQEILKKYLQADSELAQTREKYQSIAQQLERLVSSDVINAEKIEELQKELNLSGDISKDLMNKREVLQTELKFACQLAFEQTEKFIKIKEELNDSCVLTTQLIEKLSKSQNQSNLLTQKNTDLELKHQESLQKIHELENKLQSTEASNLELSAKYSATSLELESALKSISSAELCASNLLTDSLFKQVVAESEEREMMAHFEKQLALLTSKHESENEKMKYIYLEQIESLKIQISQLKSSHDQTILEINHAHSTQTKDLQFKLDHLQSSSMKLAVSSLSHQLTEEMLREAALSVEESQLIKATKTISSLQSQLLEASNAHLELISRYENCDSELRVSLILSNDLLQKCTTYSDRIQSLTQSEIDLTSQLKDEIQFSSQKILDLIQKQTQTETELKMACELSRQTIEKFSKTDQELKSACQLILNLLENYSNCQTRISELESQNYQLVMHQKDISIELQSAMDNLASTEQVASDILTDSFFQQALSQVVEEKINMKSVTLEENLHSLKGQLKETFQLLSDSIIKQSFTQAEFEITELLYKSQLNTMVSRMNEQVNSLTQRIKSTDQTSEALKLEISQINDKYNKSLEKITELECKLHSHQIEISAHENKLQLSETSHEESLQKIHELENKLQSTEASNLELSAKYSAKSLELESALKSTSSAELCASNLLTDSVFNQVVSESIKQELVASLTSKHEEMIKGLESCLTEASEQLSEALQRNSMMEAENEKILSNYREQIESFKFQEMSKTRVVENSNLDIRKEDENFSFTRTNIEELEAESINLIDFENHQHQDQNLVSELNDDSQMKISDLELKLQLQETSHQESLQKIHELENKLQSAEASNLELSAKYSTKSLELESALKSTSSAELFASNLLTDSLFNEVISESIKQELVASLASKHDKESKSLESRLTETSRQLLEALHRNSMMETEKEKILSNYREQIESLTNQIQNGTNPSQTNQDQFETVVDRISQELIQNTFQKEIDLKVSRDFLEKYKSLEIELKAACSLSFDLLEKYSEASRRLQSISASRTEDANLLRDELQAACSLSRNLIERCGKTEGELKIASDLSLEMMDKYVRSEGELKVASELSREMIEKYEKSEGELRAACLLSFNLLKLLNDTPSSLISNELKAACTLSFNLLEKISQYEQQQSDVIATFVANQFSSDIISDCLLESTEFIHKTQELQEEKYQLSIQLQQSKEKIDKLETELKESNTLTMTMTEKFQQTTEELHIAINLSKEMMEKYQTSELELKLAFQMSQELLEKHSESESQKSQLQTNFNEIQDKYESELLFFQLKSKELIDENKHLQQSLQHTQSELIVTSEKLEKILETALHPSSPRTLQQKFSIVQQSAKYEKGIIQFQASIRGFLTREKVKRKRLQHEAQKSDVLIALKNTTQGMTGWYASPDGSIYYFVMLNGEWILAVGPITIEEYELTRKSATARGQRLRQAQLQSSSMSSKDKDDDDASVLSSNTNDMSLAGNTRLTRCPFGLSVEDPGLRGDLYMSAGNQKLFIGVDVEDIFS